MKYDRRSIQMSIVFKIGFLYPSMCHVPYVLSFNYMVECNLELDSIFLSLSDGTRRDILRLLRLYEKLSVSDIALHYQLTYAAVSKHLKVLESARLVKKRRSGKHQIVSLATPAFKEMNDYLRDYESLWNDRFVRMEKLLISKEK